MKKIFKPLLNANFFFKRRTVFMLAALLLFTGASSRDIELEKVSGQQKTQIKELQAAIAQAQSAEALHSAKADQKSSTQRLAEEKGKLAEVEERLNKLQASFADLKQNPPALYEQITFANGSSFTGQTLKYENDKITIRSASGDEKTGPLTIVKSIDFHLSGLELQNFPEATKSRSPVTTRNKHADTMAKFNPALLQVVVSRGKENFHDGITKNGSRWTIDDAEKDITIKVKVAYKNPQGSLKGATLEVMALGRDLSNKKLGEVIVRQEFELPPVGPTGVESATDTVRISYYDNRYTSNPHGYDYYGYLVALKDESGKVIFTKGTRSSIEKLYDKLTRLSSGSSFSY